jgi:hypothetical protein
MNYKKIGEMTALLDVIEEAAGKKGYAVQEFEQIHPWGERSRSGNSLEVRIVPIKDAGPDAIRNEQA